MACLCESEHLQVSALSKRPQYAAQLEELGQCYSHRPWPLPRIYRLVFPFSASLTSCPSKLSRRELQTRVRATLSLLLDFHAVLRLLRHWGYPDVAFLCALQGCRSDSYSYCKWDNQHLTRHGHSSAFSSPSRTEISFRIRHESNDAEGVHKEYGSADAFLRLGSASILLLCANTKFQDSLQIAEC